MFENFERVYQEYSQLPYWIKKLLLGTVVYKTKLGISKAYTKKMIPEDSKYYHGEIFSYEEILNDLLTNLVIIEDSDSLIITADDFKFIINRTDLEDSLIIPYIKLVKAAAENYRLYNQPSITDVRYIQEIKNIKDVRLIIVDDYDQNINNKYWPYFIKDDIDPYRNINECSVLSEFFNFDKYRLITTPIEFIEGRYYIAAFSSFVITLNSFSEPTSKYLELEINELTLPKRKKFK